MEGDLTKYHKEVRMKTTKWPRRLSLVIFAICLLTLNLTLQAEAGQGKIQVKAAVSPANSNWYGAAVSLHQLINEKSRLDITSSSAAGPLAITAMVAQGLADLGIHGVNSSMAHAYNGWQDFKGKPNTKIRNLIRINQIYIAMLTTPKTGIKSAADLKGKRVAWYTASATAEAEGWLRVHGLDPDKDIIKVPTTDPGTAHNMLAQGLLDVIFGMISPSPVTLDLQQQAGELVYLPISADLVKKAKQNYPQTMAGITFGTYPPTLFPPLKIKNPINTMSIPIGVVSVSSFNEEAIYLYTKTMLENAPAVKSLNPLFNTFSFEQAASTDFDVPYHEGAIRALKEKGLWTAAQEEFQKSVMK
jgi:TRAP transporter TAXI family solute receptor